MAEFSKFDGNTSADEVVAGHDLSGRVMIVTGANTGIGFETARALSAAGARVVLGCRNPEKGAAAIAAIRAKHPEAQVECGVLDLGSFQSVRAFAEKFDASALDALILNAGLTTGVYTETASGFEATVGVCHVGHALLTDALLPKLLAGGGGRVVVVSSESHRSPKTLDFSRFPLSREAFSPTVAYGQAKLANVLFANELQRRYANRGLTACSLHPGTLITTEIGRDWWLARLAIAIASPFSKNANQGAATTVLCAIHPDRAALGGRYFSNCQPKENSAESNDPDVAKRLWAWTEARLAEPRD